MCLLHILFYMETLYFILLGVVQGLTEFLPVSSSGHLVFLDKLFGIDTGNFMLVSIILHIATLISVFILFYKDIWEIIKHPFSTNGICLILSSLATITMVLLFKSVFIESFTGKFLPICFMITAILLMITYYKTKSIKYKSYKNISYKTATIIGIMQGVAVLPGISRSGTTISTAILCNVDSEKATSYSFILSIPIILCSLVFEIYECVSGGQSLYTGSFVNLSLSFIIALICGIFAIKIMKKLAKTGKYYFFSIYLVILSIISLFI